MKAWKPTPEQGHLIEEGRRAFGVTENPLPLEAADRLLAEMQSQADATPLSSCRDPPGTSSTGS